jgi:ribosomal protein L30/L7E
VLDIEAREPNPKFSFGKIFKGIANVAKKVAPVALKAGSLLLRRDEEGNLYVRELDEDELAFLQARDPKFNLGRTFRKVKGAVSKGIRVADRVVSTAQGLGLRELDDGIYLEEREFDPSDFDLEERDFEEFDELDARDPKFNLGRFIGKARGVASKALRVADRVSSTAHSLGLREFDDEVEFEARSLDELD